MVKNSRSSLGLSNDGSVTASNSGDARAERTRGSAAIGRARTAAPAQQIFENVVQKAKVTSQAKRGEPAIASAGEPPMKEHQVGTALRWSAAGRADTAQEGGAFARDASPGSAERYGGAHAQATRH